MYSFTFYVIDSWNAFQNDKIQFSFDGSSSNDFGTLDYTQYPGHICGSPDHKDSGDIKIIGWVSHSIDSLTLKFTLNLDDLSSNESFGVRDIQLAFKNISFSSNYYCAFYPFSTFYQTRCICPQNQFNFQAINCSTCSSSSCLSCIDSGATSCYECFEGHYLPSVPGTCTSCNPICTSCFGAGTTNCYNCTDGHYLSGTTCNNCDPICPTCFESGTTNCYSCIQGYFLDETTCQNCDPACLTCFGLGTTNCYNCTQQHYLEGTSCYDCHSSCLDCSGSQYNQCTACFPGFILFRGVCIESNRCNAPSFTVDNVNNECHSPCPIQHFSSWNLSCIPECLTMAIPETDAICKSNLH